MVDLVEADQITIIDLYQESKKWENKFSNLAAFANGVI